MNYRAREEIPLAAAAAGWLAVHLIIVGVCMSPANFIAINSCTSSHTDQTDAPGDFGLEGEILERRPKTTAEPHALGVMRG
jgi:hypothetical protein